MQTSKQEREAEMQTLKKKKNPREAKLKIKKRNSLVKAQHPFKVL